jgi:hypothetical protein
MKDVLDLIDLENEAVFVPWRGLIGFSENGELLE